MESIQVCLRFLYGSIHHEGVLMTAVVYRMVFMGSWSRDCEVQRSNETIIALRL
jgi:hypothetical protein